IGKKKKPLCSPLCTTCRRSGSRGEPGGGGVEPRERAACPELPSLLRTRRRTLGGGGAFLLLLLLFLLLLLPSNHPPLPGAGGGGRHLSRGFASAFHPRKLCSASTGEDGAGGAPQPVPGGGRGAPRGVQRFRAAGGGGEAPLRHRHRELHHPDRLRLDLCPGGAGQLAGDHGSGSQQAGQAPQYHQHLHPQPEYRRPGLPALLHPLPVHGLRAAHLGAGRLHLQVHPLLLHRLHAVAHHQRLFHRNGSDQTFCWEHWPNPRHKKVYVVCTFVFGYLLPLLLISFCYAKVLNHLHKKLRNMSKKSEASKKKTAQTVLVVVVVFGISWLPHHVIHLWAEFGVFPLTQASFLFRIAAHCLAYSNSSVNPIIYAFLSENFRKAYKQVFKCQIGNESPLNDAKENKSRIDTPPSTNCTHV
uniref:Galanin receptor 1 n=1 Tax=Gallus gallus TaxID=9031 RepID=A0A8V0XVP4_CHICK